MNKAQRKLLSCSPRPSALGGGRYEGVSIECSRPSIASRSRTSEHKKHSRMFCPSLSQRIRFPSRHVRALFNRISEDERQLLTWNPDKFDWYDYWLNQHLPGLTKWVLPTLEEDMRVKPKRVYTYRDLVELFETTTKRHATRVAMRIERDGRKEQYTYADLRELATRAAAFFVVTGIKSARSGHPV